MKDEKREDTDMTDDLLQHPEKRRSDGRKELMGLTEVMGCSSFFVPLFLHFLGRGEESQLLGENDHHLCLASAKGLGKVEARKTLFSWTI